MTYIEIVICEAVNGITVTGSVGKEKVQYVYKTIDDAVKNIKAIYSVLEKQKPADTQESLDKMKEEITYGKA